MGERRASTECLQALGFGSIEVSAHACVFITSTGWHASASATPAMHPAKISCGALSGGGSGGSGSGGEGCGLVAAPIAGANNPNSSRLSWDATNLVEPLLHESRLAAAPVALAVAESEREGLGRHSCKREAKVCCVGGPSQTHNTAVGDGADFSEGDRWDATPGH